MEELGLRSSGARGIEKFRLSLKSPEFFRNRRTISELSSSEYPLKKAFLKGPK
jgi:hypothetical protein